jgi:rhodanese-related sulfurtransferase
MRSAASVFIAGVLAVLLSLTPVPAMAAGQFEPGITLVTTQELKAMIDSGEDMLLINTLSPIEIRDKSIPGSVGMPYEHIKDGKVKLPGNKAGKLVFYCKGPKCTKSPQASRIAVKRGYTNVHLYKEGLAGWGKAGYGFETIEALPRGRVNMFKPGELESFLSSNPSTVILDIRDDEVYGSMKLPFDNVIHIPLAYIEDKLNEIPAERPIVVACHHGKQSVTAAPYLKKKGFNVEGCLEGGIMNWQRVGKMILN